MKRTMRIESLTFLRFIAAILIIFFHFGRNTYLAQHANPFIGLSGPTMVVFFFVLSGFVMMVSQYNKFEQTLTSYYVRRIARIVPLYVIALLLVVFFEYGTKRFTPTAFLLCVTLLQAWFPPYPLALNFPSWAISVQAFFYLVFPVILLIVRSSRISQLKFFIYSLLIYIFTQYILSNLILINSYMGNNAILHDLIYYFPISHFCSFLLGVACGYIYVKNYENFHNAGFWPLVLLIISFSLTYINIQYPGKITSLISISHVSLDINAILFALLILSVAYSRNIITNILSLSIFVILGDSSYALYIFQKPVFQIYRNYISSYLHLSNDGHFYTYLAMLIALSVLMYYFIEKPCKNLLLKFYTIISVKFSHAPLFLGKNNK